MKKLLTVFLIILISSSLVINVCANVEQSKRVNVNASKNVVLATKAISAPVEMLEFFSKNGAEINETTTIEVLRVNNTEDTAICITNIKNNTIEKDVFVSYVENENDCLEIDNSIAESLSRAINVNQSADYPPLSWNGDYIVRATATAEAYTSGALTYYKPYKCSFYYENYEGVNVNYIKVEYISNGILYSYPGYTYLDYPEYRHVVSAPVTNPTAGRTYQNTNYFLENAVLYTDAGSPTVGQYLTFTTRVNGVEDAYTVAL